MHDPKSQFSFADAYDAFFFARKVEMTQSVLGKMKQIAIKNLTLLRTKFARMLEIFFIVLFPTYLN